MINDNKFVITSAFVDDDEKVICLGGPSFEIKICEEMKSELGRFGIDIQKPVTTCVADMVNIDFTNEVILALNSLAWEEKNSGHEALHQALNGFYQRIAGSTDRTLTALKHAVAGALQRFSRDGSIRFSDCTINLVMRNLTRLTDLPKKSNEPNGYSKRFVNATRHQRYANHLISKLAKDIGASEINGRFDIWASALLSGKALPQEYQAAVLMKLTGTISSLPGIRRDEAWIRVLDRCPMLSAPDQSKMLIELADRIGWLPESKQNDAWMQLFPQVRLLPLENRPSVLRSLSVPILVLSGPELGYKWQELLQVIQTLPPRLRAATLNSLLLQVEHMDMDVEWITRSSARKDLLTLCNALPDVFREAMDALSLRKGIADES